MEEYRLFLKLLDDDMIDINSILIKNCQKLNIDANDILVISMLSRQETKGSKLFYPEKMKIKIGLNSDDFYQSLEALTKKGYLFIVSRINPKTGKNAEYFSLDSLYRAIVNLYLDSIKEDNDKNIQTFAEKISSLYERTFQRQMTPLDVEIIKRWSDEGKFSYEDISNAIMDAAKSGKSSLKYVDQSLIRDQIKKEENPEYDDTSKVIEYIKKKWSK